MHIINTAKVSISNKGTITNTGTGTNDYAINIQDGKLAYIHNNGGTIKGDSSGTSSSNAIYVSGISEYVNLTNSNNGKIYGKVNISNSSGSSGNTVLYNTYGSITGDIVMNSNRQAWLMNSIAEDNKYGTESDQSAVITGSVSLGTSSSELVHPVLIKNGHQGKITGTISAYVNIDGTNTSNYSFDSDHTSGTDYTRAQIFIQEYGIRSDASGINVEISGNMDVHDADSDTKSHEAAIHVSGSSSRYPTVKYNSGKTMNVFGTGNRGFFAFYANIINNGTITLGEETQPEGETTEAGGERGMSLDAGGTAINNGIINIETSSGGASGMWLYNVGYTADPKDVVGENNGTINVSAHNASGMRAIGSRATIYNNENATINVNVANSYGMLAENGATAINKGTINVKSSTDAIGMLVRIGDGGTAGATAINFGTITVDGILYANSSGMKSSGSGSVIANIGTISGAHAKGMEITDASAGINYHKVIAKASTNVGSDYGVYLNGGTFNNYGYIKITSHALTSSSSGDFAGIKVVSGTATNYGLIWSTHQYNETCDGSCPNADKGTAGTSTTSSDDPANTKAYLIKGYAKAIIDGYDRDDIAKDAAIALFADVSLADALNTTEDSAIKNKICDLANAAGKYTAALCNAAMAAAPPKNTTVLGAGKTLKLSSPSLLGSSPAPIQIEEGGTFINDGTVIYDDTDIDFDDWTDGNGSTVQVTKNGKFVASSIRGTVIANPDIVVSDTNEH